MAGTFCVTVTNCRADGDKATLAFVVANAALGLPPVVVGLAASGRKASMLVRARFTPAPPLSARLRRP